MKDATLDFDESGSKNVGMEAEDAMAELGASTRTRTGTRSILPGSKKSARTADNEDGLSRSESTLGRAISSFRNGKAPKPKEIDIWKPSQDEGFGVTFEVPDDASLKGVVVSDIRSGGLAARSKKLRVGDVLHMVNGRAASTPQVAATMLREAKGVVQLVITRAHAQPKQREEADAGEEEGSCSHVAAPAAEEANTTVVVSCSSLIVESRRIVGDAGGLAERLDELYEQLKAKTVRSQAALRQLTELVGQATVEQAGLAIASAQQGTMPEGWVEYFDRANGRPYYYNVHTRTTTWCKPRKDLPPPPPPRRSGSGGSSAMEDEVRRLRREDSSCDEARLAVENHTSQGHAVSEAIAAMQTKKKMVETVQIECQRSHQGGKEGLQTVSL